MHDLAGKKEKLDKKSVLTLKKCREKIGRKLATGGLKFK